MDRYVMLVCPKSEVENVLRTRLENDVKPGGDHVVVLPTRNQADALGFLRGKRFDLLRHRGAPRFVQLS